MSDRIDVFSEKLREINISRLRAMMFEDFLELAEKYLVPNFEDLYQRLFKSLPFLHNRPSDIKILVFRFRNAPLLIDWISKADQNNFEFRDKIEHEINEQDASKTAFSTEVQSRLAGERTRAFKKLSEKRKAIYQIYLQLWRRQNKGTKTNVQDFFANAARELRKKLKDTTIKADSLRRNFDRIKRRIKVPNRKWPTKEFMSFFAFISTFYIADTEKKKNTIFLNRQMASLVIFNSIKIVFGFQVVLKT